MSVSKAEMIASGSLNKKVKRVLTISELPILADKFGS